MKLYLNYEVACKEKLIVNREQFIERNSIIKNGVYRKGNFIQTIVSDQMMQPMALLKGTPILINIEGTYVKATDLLKVCDKKDYKKVFKYVDALHGRGFPEDVDFCWKRQ